MRRFDFSVDASPAPPAEAVWLTPVDPTGKRTAGQDWFGVEPAVGDRVTLNWGDAIVVGLDRYANGINVRVVSIQNLLSVTVKGSR